MTAAHIDLRAPDGRQNLAVSGADAGLPLSDLLARRNFPLNKRCGGRGLCGGCEVELLAGSLLRLADGARVAPGAAAFVRSCQVRMGAEDVELALPPRSALRHEPAVVSEFRINIPWARDPLAPGARFGAAVDVGTTTVSLLLCDLATGGVVGQASAFNAQILFGEDVITRIQRCGDDPKALGQLQRAVAVETIAPLLREACRKPGIAPRDVAVMTVAGNTTMLHLLAGVDPTPMGVHPFRPAFLEHRTYPPRDLGLDFGDRAAAVHLLPGPAAYVGADLAAGMVATGLIYDEGPSLLVDVGTNGEIVAKAGGRLVGCATAAGPAFEGTGLMCGTRAVRGAIERVRLSTEPFAAELGVIGKNGRPLGLCGSAYVDFLWEARRKGILQANGRFDDAFCSGAGAAVQADAHGRKLRLHADGASGPVWISELDVARLLQAKSAVAAGTTMLLRALGVGPGDVKRLYLAGGFGFHLSLEHAIGCGLFPGFKPGQIQVVGNTSLGGAFLVLNDRSLLEEMSVACRSMEALELNLQPGFEDAYIDQLVLP
ncbi:MAG TPA: ASKHA domain-containing protein [Opitutaceae bacterium]|nr:ASKHA domain-containing protein [Opitutaceae bacterium]